LKLSPQQVAAAKARGFVLFPASQPQIDRMTMQRRIFDVNGRPYVVSRDGVYFETHATLAPLIADAPDLPAAVPEAAAPPTEAPPPAPAPTAEAVPRREPPAQPAEAAPEPVPPAESQVEEAAPATRSPRRRIAKPKTEPEAEAGAEEAPRKPTRRRAMAARVEETAMTAPPAAEAESQEGESTGAAGRRRLWQAEPRWRVAGAIRRGRPPRG
jgi:hypothetical protein